MKQEKLFTKMLILYVTYNICFGVILAFNYLKLLLSESNVRAFGIFNIKNLKRLKLVPWHTIPDSQNSVVASTRPVCFNRKQFD